MSLKTLYAHWKEFAETAKGRRLVKVVRGLFVTAIVCVLVYQVSQVGWRQVASSLPVQPAFYVLVLAMYFLLPATESVIYGKLWSLRPLECLGVMIRKRVLNVDLVGYSGEVYLFMWAKSRVTQTHRRIMGAIKDNLIISSLASLLAAALLIGSLLATGHLEVERFVDAPSAAKLLLGALVAVFVGVVAYRFRHVIFSLPKRVLALLGAAHLGRFVSGYVLQIAAWWVVLPEAPFQTWAILLVVFVVINRIPFLPSSDLVFISAGTQLTPMLNVPVAPIVSMLLVRSAIDRLLNLGLFSTTVWMEGQSVSTQCDTRREEADMDVESSAGSARRLEPPLNT